jgi:hypothetical protein
VYDMRRPTGDTRLWPDEIGIGYTGVDPRTDEDLFTPIYNDLRREGALSWVNAPAPIARPARNTASIGSAPRPEGPQTSPIPIPNLTGFPDAISSWEPASPMLQPRSQRPMSALARERAAVNAMLAALCLVPAPRAASPTGSTTARPRPYRFTAPPPIIPRPRTHPSFPGGGPVAARKAIRFGDC